MVPSTFRLAALALLAAVAALFAFPALRHGVDAERADARTAPAAQATSSPAAGQPELQPVRLLAREGSAEPARPARKKSPSYTVARIRAGHSVKLRSAPGGSTVASLGPRTEFGSKRVLAVAAVRGRWLGVSVPERPNGKLGWIDSRSAAIDRSRVKVSLRADLSSRRVDLLVGRRVVKRKVGAHLNSRNVML